MKPINSRQILLGLKLAWPISIQHILTNLLSMIDVVMVGHLGDSAVGAVGLGNRFIFMLTVIIMGNAWAVGVLAAQYYGAGQSHRTRQSVAMGAIVSTIALTLICLANIPLADNIMALGTSNHEVITQGQAYLWYVVPSLVFVGIIFCFENALRSLGQVRLPMLLSAVAIFVNIALNYWLINGGLGVPALGVTGAAIGTLLARIIHLLIIFALLRATQHTLNLRIEDIRKALNKIEISRFIRMAVPMMIGFGVWSTGNFVYQIIFGRMGTQELAVMSMLLPIEAVFLSLFFGLASACAIQVGQALGANQFERASTLAWSYAIASPCVSLLLGLVALALKDLILLPFETLPTDTFQLANEVYIVVVLLAWMRVVNMTLAMGALRAGGDTRAVMYVDIAGMWVVAIPLTMTAAFILEWPLILVVCVLYSEDICKGILFGLRVKQRKWLRNLTEV